MATENTPPLGSCWRHRNGNVYQVVKITNKPDDEKYPLTVVYEGVFGPGKGGEWSGRADDWHRRMTRAPDVEATIPNATFYYFKPSGKFYTDSRGRVEASVFAPLAGGMETRQVIMRSNQNHMPGLSTTGANFNVVIIMDSWVDHGWPLHLNALEG